MTALPDPRKRPLLKVAEVAAYLPDGISEKAVRAAIDNGQIKSVRVGRYVLVPTVELWRMAGIDPARSDAAPAATETASQTTSTGEQNRSRDEPTPLHAA